MHIARIVSSKGLASTFSGDGSWAEIDAPGHAGVAVVVWRMEGDIRSTKCEARARRMAASDEMFEQLRAAEELIAHRWGYPDDASNRASVLSGIRAVIAKAEGSAS